MGETEAVQRVVYQARQFARPDSKVDEQEWFEAGEPDTEPAEQLAPEDIVTEGVELPLTRATYYAIAVGALAIIALGLAIGYQLGHG